MAERILILGAGVYQVPLIAAARQRGLKTVVASRPGPYPGLELAHRFLPVDIADQEEILMAARQLGVVAVATAGADAGLPALGRVVDELGLPGPGSEAARRSASKAAMKTAFREAGVPTARFGVFADEGQARQFVAQLGFPLMIKPTDSSGSRGVLRVDDETAFGPAWREAAAHSRCGELILEQHLTGLEYGAQAVVRGEVVEAVFIHADTVTEGSPSTPVGHAMPADLPTGQAGRTEDVVRAAVAALGLRDCVANVDLMLAEGGPQVIEIGGRMGATGIPEMISLYTGWNIYDHVLDLALGQAGPLPAAVGRPNAVTLLRSDVTGTVAALEVPAWVSGHERLVKLSWDVQPGDQVRAFRVGPDRVGQLQASGSTALKAVRLAEEMRAAIRIVVQERP